ncbi:MAG: hypothetical protein WBJ10_11335 [Daejeonella sp.]|uniref:hypothetical protein n=1 Tax=Daejeonella sp. TaxID=2805397 RepID=UPI003C781128
MKKSAILVSIFIYLSATTCIGELFKAPILMTHFIEHRADDSSITFYQFIYQHYQDDDGNDKDNDRDSQLPFKSQDNSHSNTGVPLFINKIRFAPVSAISLVERSQYREPNIPSPHLLRVWQPPKSS